MHTFIIRLCELAQSIILLYDQICFDCNTVIIIHFLKSCHVKLLFFVQATTDVHLSLVFFFCVFIAISFEFQKLIILYKF